jgi:tetratricopeptide (TPR) repeat protein
MMLRPDQTTIVRGAALQSLIAHLPSTLAMVLDDYVHEVDDYRALHDMCAALEIIARFLFIVLIAELRARLASSGSDFPEPFARQLLQQFERPTLGSWRSLVDAAVDALAGADCRVQEAPIFARKFVAALGAARDDPFQKLLPMRNLVAHNQRTTDQTVSKLLEAHTTSFENLVLHLAFLRDDAGITLIACPSTGPARLLRGLSAEGREFDRSQLPQEFRQFGPDRMLLLTPKGPFDLCPLHAYGEVFHIVDDDLVGQGEDAIQIYSRTADAGGVEYTVLGGQAAYSRGAPSWEDRFAEIFRLEAWRARFRIEGALAKYTFQERMDRLLQLFIGRDHQVAAAYERINALSGTILWLTGKPGMGKSAFIAKLVRDHIQHAAQRSGVICIPYFFQASDGDRCRAEAFFEAALLGLARATGRAFKIEEEPRKRLEQFRRALREASADQTQYVRKVVIVLDGLDEVLAVDPGLIDVIFELQMPGVVWVCAGQDESALQSQFSRERCAWLFQRHTQLEALRVEREEDESYLPPLNADNVRAFFVDELGPRLPQFFGRDKRNKDGSWSNEYVEEVIRRSDGLPLYLHLLVRDIRAQHTDFAPGSERNLPKGLQEYYDRIIRRMGDDVSQTLPAAIALLSLSYEPLPSETLAVLLADHELVGQPEGRGLLETALRHGGVPLQRGLNADRVLGYRPYHSSFRQHIRQSDNVRYSIAKARERLGRLAVNWSVLAPGSAPARYALRFGPKHLIEAGDSVHLGKLIKDNAFWNERRKTLDTADALLGTMEIAEELAKRGSGYWQQLRDCAYRYCDLAETLRSDPRSLPQLIIDGKIDKARRIVDDDPDPVRRGVFKLALSVMLAKVSQANDAAELWTQGAELVGPDPGEATDPLGAFGPITRRLVRALLANGSPADKGAFREVAAVPGRSTLAERIPSLAEAASAPALAKIPLSFRVMGYFGPSRILVLALFFGLLFLIFLFTATGSRILTLAAVLGLFFVTPFMPLICGPIRKIFWLLMDRRFAKILAGFDAAITQAQSPVDRRMLLLHLLRFLGKADLSSEYGENLVDRRPWAEDLRRIIARHFQPDVFAEDAEAAASAILHATAISDAATDAVRLGAACFAPNEIQAVERELSKYPFLMLGNEGLLFLTVFIAHRSSDPALLLRFMRVNYQLKNPAGGDRYAAFLSELPPSVLGGAILRSFSGAKDAGWRVAVSAASDRALRLLGRAANYKSMATFSRAEQMILLGALAPLFALFDLIVHVLLGFAMVGMVGVGTWSLLTGRRYDAHRLRRTPIDSACEWGRAQLRERFNPQVFSGNAIEWALLNIGDRVFNPDLPRLRTMILAQEVLRGSLGEVLRGEHTTLYERARKSLAHVISELVRNQALLAGIDAREAARGVPGLAARIMLQTMGDRVLLRGMDTYRPPPRGNDSVTAEQSSLGPTDDRCLGRTAAETRDLRELERILPLPSRWQSLAVTTLMALAGISLWLGLLWRIPEAQFHAFLWPYGIAISIGSGLYAAVVQHVPRWFGTIRAVVAFGLMIWTESKVGTWAKEAGVPQAGYDYGSGWVSVLFFITPVLIANLFVPELIARWRGAGLFYPLASRLWLHRAQWSAIALAGLATFALLMWFTASGSSHSYQRALVPYEQAKSLFDRGDYNGAIAELDVAIPLLDDAESHNRIKDPVNPDAYGMRCISYEKLGELEQSLSDCSTAIRREPTARRFVGRAMLYTKLGQWDNAIPDFREAVRRDPQMFDAYLGLSWVDLMIRQPAQAIQDALDGLKVIDGPQLAATLKTNLAHGYLLDHRLDTAWSIYRDNKNVKVGPNTTFAEAVLDDLQNLRAMGIISSDLEPEVQKIELYMKAPN